MQSQSDVKSSSSGTCSLIDATFANDVAKVSDLLGKDSSLVRQVDDSGWTALHAAVSCRHIAIVRVLMQYTADVNAKSKAGRTPLHFAICNDDTEIATLLLDYNAAIEQADGLGWCPLHYAAYDGGVDMVKLLLNRGADRNAKYDDHCERSTPFDVAVSMQREDAIRILLSPVARESSVVASASSATPSSSGAQAAQQASVAPNLRVVSTVAVQNQNVEKT